MTKLKEHENYPYIKAYKKSHGSSLMEKYNAHAIGIGWKKDLVDHTKMPALILYVTPKYNLKNKIPALLVTSPEPGIEEIHIPLKVIVSEIAREEESR